MKMFRFLGALLISLMLMLTGCLKIDIVAGTGIDQKGDGDGGKRPPCGTLNNPPHPPPYNCNWNPGCTCLPGTYPPPP